MWRVVERFQVIPAAYLVLLRERPGMADEVLLTLRRGTGYMDEHWACGAAGHVEAGESVLAAAAREAHEELGISVQEHDLVPVTVMHRSAGNGDPVDERVDFFFRPSRWAGEPRRREPHKSAALGWFALDALPDPVVPHERVVLDALRHGTVPAVTVLGF